MLFGFLFFAFANAGSRRCLDFTETQVLMHIQHLHLKLHNETICRRAGADLINCDLEFGNRAMQFNSSWKSGLKVNLTPKLVIGEMEFYGNWFLDFMIYQLFFHLKHSAHPGIYLETGASNGVHASNSLFFDSFLNWTGILIEPTLCAVGQLPFNRPRASIFHGGICTNESSFDVSTMKAFCPGHQRYCKLSNTDKKSRCSPAHNYITEANLPKNEFDFASIDVEEHFMSVLLTLPWETVNFRVIAIECTTYECKQYLRERNYSLVDYVYPNKDRNGWDKTNDVIAWKNEC